MFSVPLKSILANVPVTVSVTEPEIVAVNVPKAEKDAKPSMLM